MASIASLFSFVFVCVSLQELRDEHYATQRDRKFVSLEQARRQRPIVDWTSPE